MNPAVKYFDEVQKILERVRTMQMEALERAAEICTSSIASGGLVHVFGTGHSRIPVEEMFPRHGSYAGFHPIVELSLTYHNPVVGANGQRQATFLENVSGFAARILRNTINGKVRPMSYVLPVPMILQGEKAMTTSEPFRSLVQEARRIETEGIPGHRSKILAATLFVGCAWTDSYDTGMSVMVTADGSRAAARAAAIHLYDL